MPVSTWIASLLKRRKEQMIKNTPGCGYEGALAVICVTLTLLSMASARVLEGQT
jgi:hypothetical protein